MKPALVERTLWVANLALVIGWLSLGQLPLARRSRDSRHLIRISLGATAFLLLVSYRLFLGIQWHWIAVLFFLSSLPVFLSRLVAGQRFSLYSDEVHPYVAIASWLTHATHLFLMGILLRNSLWMAGGAVILSCALVTVNLETAVKSAATILDQETDRTYRVSGFSVPEEFPIIFSMLSTSFVYFPILYFFPGVSTIFDQPTMFPWHLVPKVLGILFAAVTAIFAGRLQGAGSRERAALARVYRGFLLLSLVLAAMIAIGYMLRQTDPKILSEALLALRRASISTRILSQRLVPVQLWLAATLALTVGMVSYSVSIMFLVMGGRGLLRNRHRP